jgi:hypothetical protein
MEATNYPKNENELQGDPNHIHDGKMRLWYHPDADRFITDL